MFKVYGSPGFPECRDGGLRLWACMQISTHHIQVVVQCVQDNQSLIAIGGRRTVAAEVAIEVVGRASLCTSDAVRQNCPGNPK